MSGKKPKATRKRMISCFAQIVQEHIPGWKIEEIASGEKIKARVKWGQAPLALAFLSLVSMLSITFLISTALRHIVAELPR